MSWQILTLISVLFFAISGLLQKVLLKNEDNNPIAFSILFQIGVAIIVAIFGFFISDMRFPNLLPLTFNLLLLIILYGLGNVFIFKSLKEIEVSVFSIIFSLRVFFTTLSSALLLDQGLTFLQLSGASLILAGIALVNWEGRSIKLTKGDIYAVLAAAFFGFALTNDKFLIEHFEVYPYVFLAFILPPLAMLLLKPNTLPQMKFFLKRANFINLLILCAIYGTAAILLYTALQVTPNTSQLSAISLTTVTVTVLLSIIFLGERKRIPQKITGAILSFIGLLLVS